MGAVTIGRYAVLVLICVFSLTIIGLDGHLTDLENTQAKNSGLPPPNLAISVLGLFTAVITLLTVPVMTFSPSAWFSSNVMCQSAWFGILWVLWVATAGVATRLWTQTSDTCAEAAGILSDDRRQISKSVASSLSYLVQECHSLQAVVGVCYVTWILTMGYFGFLIYLGVSHKREWSDSVAQSSAYTATPAPLSQNSKDFA
ncbi:hypothetical protein ONZ45_g5945 [Pleurotus djamor]|nr:hypothetical protein ONZ45_g5945 [Pleurotus djamor]